MSVYTQSTKHYCNSKSDVPNGEHFVIIEFGSVRVPETGVWAPGHGYPAHDEATASYISFTNEEEWKAEILKLEAARYGTTNYVAFKAIPAKITNEIKVSI